jgi:AraC-like DNA-binding protein
LVTGGFLANYLFFVTGSPPLSLAISWRVMSVVLVAAAIATALRGRNADLVEPRRRARLALSLVIALVILWIVVSELPLRGWPPPVGWRVVNAASLFLLAATLALTILGWRDPALLAAPAKPQPTTLRPEADDSVLLTRLDTDMRHERLYRQDGLTITTVAARLGVPEYRLRRAINQGLGARNFNAYLNGFRLGEAREALADPEQREVPILTIALDAGFGSLAPFNRAFRDSEGCTPTEFRARALIEL